MSIWSSSLRRRMPRIYSSITAAQHGGSTRTQHAGKGPDRLRATQSFLPCDALHGEQPPASGWLDPCMLAPSNVVRLLAGDEAGSQISAAFVSHWPERPASPLVVVSGMQARTRQCLNPGHKTHGQKSFSRQDPRPRTVVMVCCPPSPRARCIATEARKGPAAAAVVVVVQYLSFPSIPSSSFESWAGWASHQADRSQQWATIVEQHRARSEDRDHEAGKGRPGAPGRHARRSRLPIMRGRVSFTCDHSQHARPLHEGTGCHRRLARLMYSAQSLVSSPSSPRPRHPECTVARCSLPAV
jgi:hypothetical protein